MQRKSAMLRPAQYAMTLEPLRQRLAPESRPLHLVVTGELSRTLQSPLERSSCDIVVAQPVDPSALRLLILRALYQGTKGDHELAVFFDALDAAAKQAVRALIESHALGGTDGVDAARDIEAP